MIIRVGLRLKSAVSEAEIIVVKAPGDDLDIRCGGVAMVECSGDSADGELDPQFAEPTLLGKRYVDADERIEVLCTKGGDGQLSLGDEPLGVKDAKPLPSSD